MQFPHKDKYYLSAERPITGSGGKYLVPSRHNSTFFETSKPSDPFRLYPHLQAPVELPQNTGSENGVSASVARSSGAEACAAIPSRSQLKRFECTMCAKQFQTKWNQKKHFRVCHQKILNFQCNKCERRFGARNNLVRHNRDVHEKIRAHPCTVYGCEQAFSQRATLKRHLSLKHKQVVDGNAFPSYRLKNAKRTSGDAHDGVVAARNRNSFFLPPVPKSLTHFSYFSTIAHPAFDGFEGSGNENAGSGHGECLKSGQTAAATNDTPQQMSFPVHGGNNFGNGNGDHFFTALRSPKFRQQIVTPSQQDVTLLSNYAEDDFFGTINPLN